MKKLVVTPLSNKIIWATVNEKTHTIVGERKDVTDDAIQAVLEHFLLMKEFEKGFYGYTFDRHSGKSPVNICAFDSEKYVVVKKELYDTLVILKKESEAENE